MPIIPPTEAGVKQLGIGAWSRYSNQDLITVL